MAEIGFDYENAEDVSFTPVPGGKYKTLVAGISDQVKEPGETPESTPVKMTRRVELEIMEGQYKGRKINDFQIIHHPSEMAQKIGRGRFKQLVLSIGIRPNDTDDLVGHENWTTVKVGKDQSGNPCNQVTSYAAIKGAAPATPAAPQQAAPAQGNGKKPAWQK